MLKKWMLKAAVQRAISLSPGSHQLNRMMQKYVTRTTVLRQWDFDDHLRTDTTKLDHYAQRTPDGGVPRRVLEIGTGWHPILPIAMWLAGAERVDTVDIRCNLTDAQVQETLDAFHAASEDGRLARYFPRAIPDRVRALLEAPPVAAEGYVAWLRRFGVVTHVSNEPYGAIADASVDLIVSVSVLEYFPRALLVSTGHEFARVLRPGGVMIHDVSLADQYAFMDGSISKLNFLRYSRRAWRIINSPLIPLSRLRASDYVAAFGECGFDTELLDIERVEESEARSIPLAAEFRHYSLDDIAIIRTNFVSGHATRTPAHSHATSRDLPVPSDAYVGA